MPLFIRITVVVIQSRSVCMKIRFISGMMGDAGGLDSTDKLFMKHSSKPYNPKLANVFFMSGIIEAWDVDLIRSKKLAPDMTARCWNIISASQGLWFFARHMIDI